MKLLQWASFALILLAGCARENSQPQAKGPAAGPGRQSNTSVSLAEARRGFQTKLARKEKSGEPVPQPPEAVFSLVQYESPVGKLAAYLTPDPKDGKKHPAIVWITGGDCNTIGEVWNDAPPENDQTASAYRKAGIVMMFPSLRGGNHNPGVKEGFFGEVDDVLAAADFLAKQDYVDPQRIYLGGHSSGGTLVLLVAECSDRFRAVFSFGPTHDVRFYPDELLPFDKSNRREFELRAPGFWLHSIKSATFAFEGTRDGNLGLQIMAGTTDNPAVHWYPVPYANHFSVLAPVNRLLAAKVLLDDGPTCNIAIAQTELNNLGPN
jgi:acetyl esterase/lipase